MTHMRHVSGEKVEGTYTTKSAITISEDGTLVGNSMFSGLIISHEFDAKASPMNDKGWGNILEIPVDDVVRGASCRITQNWA